MTPLSFSFLGVPVAVRCSDPSLRRLFLACYGPRSRGGRRPLRYAVTASRGDRLALAGPGDRRWRLRDEGDLLYFLDGDLSVQLQKRRPDLYFLHSAVLGRHGLAALLVGPSGVGKSTAAWALSHHGFDFKGDELAPIDIDAFRVYPYFRALCLKTEPPRTYPLPPQAHRTSRGWHIPARLLRGGRGREPLRIGAIFFPHRNGRRGPAVRRIRPADAAVRLYACSLNALAHPEDGLPSAVRLATGLSAFEVRTSNLPAAAAGIAAVLARESRRRRRREASEEALLEVAPVGRRNVRQATVGGGGRN